MQRFFDQLHGKKVKLAIGHRIGKLVVSSEPYYYEAHDSGEHRRSRVDCVCDCGETREGIRTASILKDGIFPYCSRECRLYLDAMPKDVPEESKLCFLGERYNYLIVTKEAFYQKLKGESNRQKCIEVQCDCGKMKVYREDKVKAGKYKSCGCVWEYTGENGKNWKHLKKAYGMSEDDYNNLLEKQNGVCGICGTDKSWNNKTSHFYVDHCHDTGKIRGLLCNGCNSGLGHFKDSEIALEAAIRYLEKTK